MVDSVEEVQNMQFVWTEKIGITFSCDKII